MRRFRISVFLAVVVAAVAGLSVAPAPHATAATTTLVPSADARVEEANPGTNYGGSSLRVDAGSGPDVESYLKFSVGTLPGAVTSATLRVFATTGTVDGPAVFTTSTSWSETALTWGSRPARTSAATADKGSIASGWVEFNITSLVPGSGTFSFVLAGTSSDGVDFTSREGSTNKPQLVIGTGTSKTGDPVVATAGDVACSTSDSNYNGGNGTATACRQKWTSNLLVGAPDAAVLALGDLQYSSGSLSSYQAVYDPTWGRVKSITRPVPGNHDYNTSGASGYFSYFGSLASPQEPTCTSGCKGYYSFDIGTWHMIALNSNCDAVPCTAGSPQETWLRQDLASHRNMCTLAFDHHARWSSGHGGDNAFMQPMWENLVNAGAEILLSGHSHHYERFAPQNASGGADPPRGVRQFVVGTGGAFFTGVGTPHANSQVLNNNTFGVLRLTLHPTSYDWTFVPDTGSGSLTDSGSTACH